MQHIIFTDKNRYVYPFDDYEPDYLFKIGTFMIDSGMCIYISSNENFNFYSQSEHANYGHLNRNKIIPIFRKEIIRELFSYFKDEDKKISDKHLNEISDAYDLIKQISKEGYDNYKPFIFIKSRP